MLTLMISNKAAKEQCDKKIEKILRFLARANNKGLPHYARMDAAYSLSKTDSNFRYSNGGHRVLVTYKDVKVVEIPN